MIKRIFIILIVATAVFMPGEAAAQSDVRIEAIDIGLWPEFDRPEMLVIYRIMLAEDTTLPVQVSFRIPTRAGEPHAVADDVTGDKAYSLNVQGEWTQVIFTAEGLFLQIEFYDPALDASSSPRHYDFEWPGDYAVTSSVINIKLPGDSDNVVISPSFGSGQTGEDGYLYYQAVAGELPAGEPFNISLDYERGGVDFQQWVVWGIGALGVVLIGWGGYRFMAASRASSNPSRHRRKPAASGTGGARFCHSCGEATKKGDQFCRNCGTELR
ncbi:MAG: zinc ribbon domain-containing protein [Anaerolineae bacterium]|nr:zinc ribbon domain-containing protein [Anaerolineae bacterium]